MKNLIWTLLLLSLAVGLAVFLNGHTGEAHIVLDNTLYSMNLGVFVIALLLLWLLVWLCFKIVRTVLGLPGGFRRWRKNHHQRKADKELSDAGMAFFEGRHKEVRDLTQKLLKNQESKEKLPLALVLAAFSAQQTGDTQERDRFLKELETFPEKHQVPRFLLLAEDAFASGDYEKMQKHLQSARKISPDLLHIVQLDLRRAIAQQDADSILKYTSQLLKKRAISEKEAISARRVAYQKLLSEANDASAMKRCLKKIPTEEQNGALAAEIARKLRDNGQFKDVAIKVERCYETGNTALLDVLDDVFPHLSESSQQRTLAEMEKRLTQTPEDAYLLQSLGRMAYVKKLWGKSQSYCEASLSVKDAASTRLLLSQVFADSGHQEKAEEQRHQAMSLLTKAETVSD